MPGQEAPAHRKTRAQRAKRERTLARKLALTKQVGFLPAPAPPAHYSFLHFLLAHIAAFGPLAENPSVTPRPAEAMTEPGSDTKAERPKPPTSLLADALQALPPKPMPIVSPDRSLLAHSSRRKTKKKAHFQPLLASMHSRPEDCVVWL